MGHLSPFCRWEKWGSESLSNYPASQNHRWQNHWENLIVNPSIQWLYINIYIYIEWEGQGGGRQGLLPSPRTCSRHSSAVVNNMDLILCSWCFQPHESKHCTQVNSKFIANYNNYLKGQSKIRILFFAALITLQIPLFYIYLAYFQ